MAKDDDLQNELDQHMIAERILLNTLRLTLDHPKAMDRETVSGMLAMAAAERDRQGDYRAASLLVAWSDLSLKRLPGPAEGHDGG